MPTYEYECSACGYTLEALQSITGKRLRKCPKCGKSSLDRLIGTGGGIIFKGSGFYETDYKKKSAPPAECPAQSTSSGKKASLGVQPQGGCCKGGACGV